MTGRQLQLSRVENRVILTVTELDVAEAGQRYKELCDQAPLWIMHFLPKRTEEAFTVEARQDQVLLRIAETR